ncbi:T4SS efffector SepA family protein [Brevundimonas sp.]|jgi:hypothetical protein|uniref:T4SS efffector SepA family protein n=1 Tax=Brevundimonas sp. TaxID=1871086 RepID=UPI0028B20EE4|nr:hypothetical protein [Brevundimonas sp.]
MPHTFELSDENFAGLQKHAIPLKDDLNSVIAKLLASKESVLEADEEATEEERRRPIEASKKFDAATPPDLTHTKLIAVIFDGKVIEKPTWNKLKDAAIRAAYAATPDQKQLGQMILCPFTKGQKTDEGYRFFEDINLSVQGQDALSSYKVAYHIALALGLSMRVQFIWRQKEAAQFPGVTGLMHKPA